MSEILKVNDLKISFSVPGGDVLAVDGVSFRVRQGSLVALVGESGSGKSVIAQAIMGILPKNGRVTGGEILFSDPASAPTAQPVDIARMAPQGPEMRAIRGGRISIIFQEPMSSLSQLHTIGDQIGEALHLHRDVGKQEGRDLMAEMLRLAGFPDPAKAVDTYPFELSGGLRQRAMIAMALVCHPALLIADEPTTALDVTIQAQILQLIRDLQAELNMAVLMITHDLGVVANVAEEVVVLHRGRVMESGTTDDIFRNPGHPYLQALLRAVPRLSLDPGERLVPIRTIEHDSGHMLAAKKYLPRSAEEIGPLLRVRNLTKTFRIRKEGGFFGAGGAGLTAVDDVTFDLRHGECLGLVGESGCGKTTLAKLLMRAILPDRGNITFNDRGHLVDMVALDDKALIPFRRKIQLVFQDPFGSLNPRMTVSDIIGEPLIIHKMGDAAFRHARVTELLRLVGLDERALNRYPHSFSGGERQRIGIARALALKPELLICDEPVSALDVSIQAQVLNLLRDLKDEFGLSYLFISHNLAVVNYVADRIMVMCGGRIVEMAPRERLFHHPVHPYTKTLLAAVPDPDPDQKLDFTQLRDSGSDPTCWPEPFTITEGKVPDLIAIGEDHYVRTQDTMGVGASGR